MKSRLLDVTNTEKSPSTILSIIAFISVSFTVLLFKAEIMWARKFNVEKVQSVQLKTKINWLRDRSLPKYEISFPRFFRMNKSSSKLIKFPYWSYTWRGKTEKSAFYSSHIEMMLCWTAFGFSFIQLISCSLDRLIDWLIDWLIWQENNHESNQRIKICFHSSQNFHPHCLLIFWALNTFK